MKKSSASAGDLKQLIKHAIEDLEVTPTEYPQNTSSSWPSAMVHGLDSL